MSRSTERERARLNGAFGSQPTADIASGLTFGRHAPQIITTTDDDRGDEIFDFKRRILAGDDGHGLSTDIRDGLTYGDPLSNAERAQRNASTFARGAAMLEQDNLDREELRLRREQDHLDEVLNAIGDAQYTNWRDESLVRNAAHAWGSLTPAHREHLTEMGELPEEVAIYLNDTVLPTQANIDSRHNAEATVAAGRMQKGLALMRIKEERGSPSDAEWSEHQRAVFARAHEQGINLGDDRMGSHDFDAQFRAAEIALAEDRRAQANANFQAEVLNASSTDIDMGLTENGEPTFKPLGEISVKPDYAKAAARLGGEGDPRFDSGADIKQGIFGATGVESDSDMRRVQAEAGELFSAAERDSIARKLGER